MVKPINKTQTRGNKEPRVRRIAQRMINKWNAPRDKWIRDHDHLLYELSSTGPTKSRDQIHDKIRITKFNEYLGSVLGVLDEDEELLTLLPLPLIQMVKKQKIVLIQRRLDKTEERKRELQADKMRRADAQRKEADKLASMDNHLQNLDPDKRIRFLASIEPEYRKKLGSPQERRSAVEMRKSSKTSTRTREYLVCSITELDRWDKEGLLPHLYTRINMYGTETRYWALNEIENAFSQLSEWRQKHEVTKSFNRHGLKVCN